MFKLIIEYPKKTFPLFYLLISNENFNFFSFKLEKNFGFFKKIIRRSKINQKKKCIDYDLIGCSSRLSCLDKCIRETFSLNYSKIYYYAIMHKSEFTEQQWASLNFATLDHSLDLEYKKVKEECDKKLSYLDCTEMKLAKETYTSILLPINRIQIDLNYDILSILEQEPEIFSFLFYMLNIEVILLGINFKKLIYKLLRLVNFKYKKHLIHMISFFGFTYHLFFIFSEIVSGELTYNQFYQKLNNFDAPDLIFCFNYPNPSLKSEYSNYETLKAARINNWFDKIEYLNESNSWTTLSRRNFLNRKDIEFELFYFSNKECFILKLNFILEPDQFHFQESSNIIKIYFNRLLIYYKKETVSFMVKRKNYLEFSKSLELNFRDKLNNSVSSEVRQEIYEITYKDEFSFIKKSIPFFYNDHSNSADHYLRRMTNDFERNKVLKQKAERQSIETSLKLKQFFEKFVYQIQNKTRNLPTDLTNKRFAVNYLAQSKSKGLGDFAFSRIFFRRIIEVRNGSNYSKLIHNLLSTISLWYDVGIFNFYLIIHKLQINRFILKILRKCKI